MCVGVIRPRKALQWMAAWHLCVCPLCLQHVESRFASHHELPPTTRAAKLLVAELHGDFGSGYLVAWWEFGGSLRALLGTLRVWAAILKSRHSSKLSSRYGGRGADRPEASSIPPPHLRTHRNQNNTEVICSLSFSYITRFFKKKSLQREDGEKR